jgi:hypothetical protein
VKKQVRRQRQTDATTSLFIQNLVDGHPNHRSIASVMRCRDGCARRLAELPDAIRHAEEAGRIPRVPRGKAGL